MGTRDNYETVTRVIQAFAAQRTWRQAELARDVGIEARRLRTVLLNLSESGMPLEKDEEHPHVYWSVPHGWFPDRVIFDSTDWAVLLHAISRVAEDHHRNKLLARLLAGRSAAGALDHVVDRVGKTVAATPISSEEHALLLLIENSLLEGRALDVRYFAASKGQLTDRSISPQRLFTEPHGRIVGYCHSQTALRWFRIDNIQRAAPALGTPYHEVTAEELSRFLETSVDGYRDGTEERHAFTVRHPASAWVRRNLLQGMRIIEQSPDALVVEAIGGALVVARFVAGLGGDAVAQGETLRGLVRQLAQDALETHR